MAADSLVRSSAGGVVLAWRVFLQRRLFAVTRTVTSNKIIEKMFFSTPIFFL